MPLLKMKKYFVTSRKNINQNKQHVNMVSNKQTGKDARGGKVIDKQRSILYISSVIELKRV